MSNTTTTTTITEPRWCDSHRCQADEPMVGDRLHQHFGDDVQF